MSHGEEKARDMTRSLLPSRHRASARYERASIHRSARRQSHVELAQLAREPESFEDLAGLDDDVTGEIRRMVRGRRAGDKLAPFIRWARAITRELPQHSRMGHLQGLVPPGVIGDHALFHLSNERDFVHPAEAAHREALRRRWARDRTPPWLERGEQAELLRALVLAPGGHRAFNRWLRLHHVTRYRSELRRRPCSCEPGCTILETVSIPVEPVHPRMLRGVHDVLPFLEALWGSGARHDRWRSPAGPCADQAQAVDTFLRAFKEHRRDVASTVKALRLEQRMNGFNAGNRGTSP
ncbi:MAG TPA: hypothetical protein VEU33_00270 [Archangium sp.]|nr:hypothetical protein [Archangium sp.]